MGGQIPGIVTNVTRKKKPVAYYSATTRCLSLWLGDHLTKYMVLNI